MERKFILVVGLGSMGKRRVRNLQSLGKFDILGVDLRADRRLEAEQKYDIVTYSDADDIFKNYTISALIISLPPDIHHIYIKKAIENGLPAFVEASVVDTDFTQIIEELNRGNICIAPSCTLYFHPAIKKIRSIIKSGELGTISNYIYHSGQFLPDWHTYETVSEYYVSKKATGGAREIVPFELTWITMILGFPLRITGFYKKTINIQGAEEIDDTYNILMDYGNSIFNLSVDVVSRYATRRLTINGDKKQLYWNWDDDEIKIFESENNKWKSITYNISSAQTGYNKNITEQMYVEEMDTFLKAATGKCSFPNSMINDHKVLKLLYAVEDSDDNNLIQQL